MFWLGKLLGCLFGYMIAGPVGAIFGLLLGHYFDLSCKGHWFFQHSRPQHTHAQDIFFRATFTIMGYIAKADGRVSENEIRAATQIMQNMRLNPQLKRQAITYFKQGKSPHINIDEILDQLSQACYQQSHLLHLFLEIQIQAAFADGALTANKRKILEYICYHLNLNPNDFFQSASDRYEHTYSRNQQRQQYYRPTQEPNALAQAYRVLGVSAATNNSDLKKAYRKLMSQHHPDKLVSKGLPEEMLKLATQKTQEIKSAYETICKTRGI